MMGGMACIGSATVPRTHPVRRPGACPETRVETETQAARTRPTVQRPVAGEYPR